MPATPRKRASQRPVKEFGDRCRSAREALGLSQVAIAAELDIDAQVYSRYECGRNYPKTITLIALSKVLKVSLDWLIFGDSRGP